MRPPAGTLARRRLGARATALVAALLTGLALAVGPGEVAPGFTLVDAAGEVVRLEDFRGRPLVLNAWAVWCPFCVEEIPLLQRAHDAIHRDGAGASVLLVNLDEPFDEAAAFLREELDVDLPTAFDATEAHRDRHDVDFDRTFELLTRRYRLRGMPTTYFIDADGVVRAVHVGPLTPQLLAARLEAIGVEWTP